MRRAHILISILLLVLAVTVKAATASTHVFAETSVLSEGQWMKIYLDGKDDGVYQITYDQLRKMGFKQPEMVGIYGFGGHILPEKLENIEHDDLPEVATMHDAKNNRILFYGQGMVRWDYTGKRGFMHRQNSYETRAYYFLHQKGEAPRQMEELPHNAGQVKILNNTYLAHEVHESDLVNLGQTGREKYGESFLSNKSQRFTFGTFAPGSLRITVNAIAKSSNESTYTILANENEIGELELNSTTNVYAFATENTFDRTITLSETKEVNVTLTFESLNNKADLARLNYIRLQGRRQFVLPETCYTFRDDTADEGFDLSEAYGATGDAATLASSPYQIWDVTSATGVKRQLLSDKATFAPASTEIHEYVMVNTEARNLPGVIAAGKVGNQNLHELSGADMVIVTAPAYLEEAERLADYRQRHDKLNVIVVTPQEIYNEFSSGGQDVTAIRLLMKKIQPRYLLLMGDSFYDNQKINRQYQLPCYETDASLAETASCVCDDYFGFIEDGEGGKTDAQNRYLISEETLDIGIGRLPVNTVTEARLAVDKIIAYSRNRYQGNWKSRLCFLSDDDKDGDSFNAHIIHNEKLVDILEKNGHQDFIMQKIYLPAYKQTATASGTDYPDAKKEFMESLKQGVLLVNYAGHGSSSAITNENLMTSAIASQLSMRYLPVWVTASCDVGRWDGNEESLGEILTLNPNGGAIAMFTTVRVVYAHQNLILNQAIIDNLFNRHADGTRYRLGDVLMSAKKELGKDYNKLNFCLLGDPSTTMTYPEQELKLTEVNGVQIDSKTTEIKLKALDTVTMKGVIYKLGSTTEIDSTFNGLVFPTLYDALDTLVADKGYLQAQADPITFTTRTRKAFAGRGEVTDGRFEFSFMVPQDISYSGRTGLAALYACSDEWKEAQGCFDRYTLVRGEDKAQTDTIGPEIRRLFLNDMLFTEGAVVNSTPYFYAEVEDESGFNMTGNGIGHDMILTIKCTSNPMLSAQQYILNNYFTTYTGHFDLGCVQYSIPALEDGDYEASFTVWDVFNNASRQTFHFTVAKGKAPNALAVQAYPSPAKCGEALTFRVLHNLPESETEMKLEVFNSLGHLVYETAAHINNAPKHYAMSMEKPTIANTSILADETPNFMGSSAIEWASPNLDAGFYVYHIVLTSNGSQKISESKVLIIKN